MSTAMASTKTEAGREFSMELKKLFNKQVTNELRASQLYLAASIWCDENELVGMAKYMRSESDEERGHAMGFIDFANKKNIPLKLENVVSPTAEWKSPLDLWEDVLKAETENTESLMKLGDAAAECDDHAIATFLQPYHMVCCVEYCNVTFILECILLTLCLSCCAQEQVESEDELRTIVTKVKDESETPGLIRQLDNELGKEATD